MKRLPILIFAAAVIANPAMAADIASDTRSGVTSPINQDGGYFELGAYGGFVNNPTDIARYDSNGNDRGKLGLLLAGEYRYKGFFIEAAAFNNDGLNLGYNLGNTNHWSIDLVLYNGNIIIEDDKKKFVLAPEAERNDQLPGLNRFQGAGLRLTGYLDDYIVQVRAVSDYESGTGSRSSLRAGRSWQLKNWNFHSILGVEYDSASYNQERFGITAEQASSRFPEYQPDGGFTFQGEIGVTYPLNEDWVFRSLLRYRKLPSEIENSPLIDEHYGAAFLHSISYVF